MPVRLALFLLTAAFVAAAPPQPSATFRVPLKPVEVVGSVVTYDAARFHGRESGFTVALGPAGAYFRVRFGFKESATKSVWFSSNHRAYEDAAALEAFLGHRFHPGLVGQVTGRVTAITDLAGRTVVDVDLLTMTGTSSALPGAAEPARLR